MSERQWAISVGLPKAKWIPNLWLREGDNRLSIRMDYSGVPLAIATFHGMTMTRYCERWYLDVDDVLRFHQDALGGGSVGRERHVNEAMVDIIQRQKPDIMSALPPWRCRPQTKTQPL